MAGWAGIRALYPPIGARSGSGKAEGGRGATRGPTSWGTGPGRAIPPDERLLATVLSNWAQLEWDTRRYQQAEALSLRALAVWEKAVGPEHPNLAIPLMNRAAILGKLKRRKEAEQLEAQARGITAR